ncbi:P pilus assembly protein, chaperone PapD [Cronbergia sp. UHCC 0137]|uniref:P pilus assembly protein, chaperone PapD n=1 Tax=Cronbergia sp. UHCC 0137 TaxID=3110239 RepID=UPI002B205D0A|nr:P pilus assembly protein, chaperone PapD [Cronbergia sp. UHCC 0137]MEA5617298.1 P pilus assembly protein, chaperone PapD [Cronbergia sp. UHCC 0137]
MFTTHSSSWQKVLNLGIRVATGGLIGLPLLLSSQTAQAQSLNLIPSIVELDTERGQAEGVFTVRNISTTSPVRARLYAEPFSYTDIGLQPEPKSTADLTPYLVFSPREITVGPGQTRQVRLVTRIPRDVTDKEYRAVVYVQSLTESPTNPNLPKNAVISQMGIVTRIGATVYARQGKVAPNLKVTGVSYDPKQRQILLGVQNTGNASTRPHIEWTLTQGGKEIINTVQGPASIVSNSSRKFPINYPAKKEKPLPPGTYNFSGKVVWVNKGWALNSKVNQNVAPFNFSFTIPAK